MPILFCGDGVGMKRNRGDFQKIDSIARKTVTADGMNPMTGKLIKRIKADDKFIFIYKKIRGIGYRIQEVKFGEYERWHDTDNYTLWLIFNCRVIEREW